MSKRSQNQGISLRRFLLQTVRLAESSRNQILNEVECAQTAEESPDTTVKNESHFIDIDLSSDADGGSPGSQGLCNICFIKESSDVPFFSLELCGHKFCTSCLIRYLKNEISESRTDIACPQCSCGIHPNNVEQLLEDHVDIKNKYHDFTIRRYLITDPDCRWCPAPDCNYAVLATGCASCPEIKCERPNCGTRFCYHCKAIWHPDQTCDAARSSRQKNVLTSSGTFALDITDEIKPCPRCQVLIVKMNDGSCNHMACSLCGSEFCWLCMKEVSDLHYLSPSGCTFWGKKPWSRKKKIVWQIGTLIGAPVGIALLAGIAVPSIVIGVPVWAGRKLLNKYKATQRKKRNISVAVGVTASILVAPILAGLAIAVGVPILLFYVYGIVPVSLIRAGCGNSKNDDMKFDEKMSNSYAAHYNVDNKSINNEDLRTTEQTNNHEESSICEGNRSSITIDVKLEDTCFSTQQTMSKNTTNETLEVSESVLSNSASAVDNSNLIKNNNTTSSIILAGSITNYKG